MKSTILLILSLGIVCFISSCGGSGEKRNEEQSSMAGTVPNAADAPDFKIDMTAEHVARGKAIYLETCGPCHGAGGKGDGPAAVALNPKPRDHTNGAYMDKLTNGHIFAVIRKGGSPFGYPGMPAQPQLADSTIKNVIAYVRSLSSTYRQ